MSGIHYFVTGGAGYIGSHTCLALLKAGHQVTIFDNFANASRDVIDRLEALSGCAITLIDGDITDFSALDMALSTHPYEAVLHFAGLKSVADSFAQKTEYFACNVGGTENLLTAMKNHDVNQIVFSSSATVYGNNGISPIKEDTPLDPINPYGQTKADCEVLIEKHCQDNSGFAAAILRYFNPVGADKSGKIGELPQGTPANLMPIILEVAVNERDLITLYGDDYNTIDGTGVRDFIHVTDLAAGHVAALNFIKAHPKAHIINLGTGRGYSVKEMIETFERVTGVRIPYRIGPRRDGDIGEVIADPSHAKSTLGWETQLGLDDMCRDAWRWKKAIAK